MLAISGALDFGEGGMQDASHKPQVRSQARTRTSMRDEMTKRMNKFEETARWVSMHGKKNTLRDDPFAHAATFSISDGGFEYVVNAHSSPYSRHGQSFELIVKKDGVIVCKYSHPDDVVKTCIGKAWLRRAR